MFLNQFSAIVQSINYNAIEPLKYGNKELYKTLLDIETFEDEFGESIEKEVYYAKMSMREVKRGSKSKVQHFSLILFLEKEDYENQVIEIGDVLTLKRTKLYTSPFSVKSFEEEKIKKSPSRKVKIDPATKKPFVMFRFNAARLCCGVGDWAIKIKHDNLAYWNICRVHFCYDTKQELLARKKFSYFIDKKEYDFLFPNNGKIVKAIAYYMKNKVAEMDVKITVGYKRNVDKFACNIIAVDSEGNPIQ